MQIVQQPSARVRADDTSPIPTTGRSGPWSRLLLVTTLSLAVGGAISVFRISPLWCLGAAALGILLWGARQLWCWRVRRRWKVMVLASIPLLAVCAMAVRTHLRYKTADVMEISIREYGNEEYPEDPANRSVHHGKYHGRRLSLVRKDASHFDFVFDSEHAHVATIAFRDVDVSLMTPGLPQWTREDEGLRRIALTDRQWNRQQVRFDPGSAHVEVSGGDGFERQHLFSAELAKNCLNAGLWEVLLFLKEGTDKALYYQGWFTFPLGHYQRLFEQNTGLRYREHWYYLEHWFDPVGTHLGLPGLRRVVSERNVPTRCEATERVLAAGEQIRKRKTTLAENVNHWAEFYDGRRVEFAAFVPPGRYSVQHPWKNQYWRMQRFGQAILRDTVSPASAETIQELEFVFHGGKDDGVCRFIVSGIDLKALPRLPVQDYPKGLYMPMGIGVPPFFQSYTELQQRPPQRSPYFSVLLDAEGKWIDHHSVGVDGPVMHLDAENPLLLHVYLLSYERHTLVRHLVVSIGSGT